MRKETKRGAMVAIVMAMVIGGFLTATAPNVSGATKVDLYAGDPTTSSVRLTWTETEDWFFDHYEVYMNDGSGWRLMKTFQSKYTLECTVTGLDSGTTYSFKVRDVDSFGWADSDPVTITTDSSWGDGLSSPTGMWLIIIIIIVVVVIIVIAVAVALSKKK